MDNSMSTSRIDIDKLIAEVQLRPELWTLTESMPHARTTAWKEIAAKLGSKVPLIKLKWKNVRDIFRREYIKNSLSKQAKLTSPDDYTGKWRYFKELWPVFKTLRTSCNMDNKIKHFYENYEEFEDGTEPQEGSEGEFEVKINNSLKGKRRTIIKQSPQHDDNDDEEYNHENERIFVEDFVPETPRDTYVPESARDTETDRDYDSMYLNSLLPFFKMLSPVRKLTVRNKIQELLIKELNAVDKM